MYYPTGSTRYDSHTGQSISTNEPSSQDICNLANEIRESNRLKRLELMFLMSGKRMSLDLLLEVTKDEYGNRVFQWK